MIQRTNTKGLASRGSSFQPAPWCWTRAPILPATRQTLRVLDSVGDRTGHVLNEIAVDPYWLLTGGRGVFAPPAKDQLVAILWLGDESGQPVIAAAAPAQPARPRRSVDGGQYSLQGDEWDMRMLDGEWYVRDDAGAVLSGKSSRWLVAGPAENLHAVLQSLVDVIQAAMTITDTDTASGGAGRELGLNAATIAALEVIATRLSLVLRS